MASVLICAAGCMGRMEATELKSQFRHTLDLIGNFAKSLQEMPLNMLLLRLF